MKYFRFICSTLYDVICISSLIVGVIGLPVFLILLFLFIWDIDYSKLPIIQTFFRIWTSSIFGIFATIFSVINGRKWFKYISVTITNKPW